MLEGVECQTPEVVSGVVTAFVSDVSVSGLVQGKREQNNGHTEYERNDNIADITAGKNIK